MRFRSFILILTAFSMISSCSVGRKGSASSVASVNASLDLVNVTNDQVKVTVQAPGITGTTVDYIMAKLIPGTYAIADYGRYVDDFRAVDKGGNALEVVRKDVNTWSIRGADKLASVSYLVNDTYDNEKADAFQEGSTTIFSPAGTNILAGKNFMLNLCGFVGYFDGKKDFPYVLSISHPATLAASTSLDDLDKAKENDVFKLSRYSEVVDHPIMYAMPDVSSVNLDGMEVILSVYSPNNKAITSAAFFPDLTRMMRAQKKYLGSINTTKKYAVLTYISSMNPDDAKGFGALEHNTSTTAVFTETMQSTELIHVISHEFFHTLTPLKVHSREIQDFNFIEPVMSKHLWMYEGFTEYFAQHFQVHEGLVNEEKFFARMAEKEVNSKTRYDDGMSFLTMSKNVLDPKMKAQYPNVYEKGALLAMCLDIILREKTNGKSGILHLMDELSRKYGPEKPFNDDEIIDEITRMTYPEVGDFLQTHVVKGTPVKYEDYLAKVGLSKATMPVPTITAFFTAGNRPTIRIDTVSKKIFALGVPNDFFTSLGVQENDELLSLNNQVFKPSEPTQVLIAGIGLEEGSDAVMKIRRNGNVMELKGKLKLNYQDGLGYKVTDLSKAALREAWLKN